MPTLGAKEMASEKTSLVQSTIEEETSGELAEEYHDVSSRPSSKTPRKTETPKKKTVCPDYFGVRSYLHDFYEATYKDPSIYEEEDDFRFLLGPHPRRRRCPPIWWKVFMWIGVNLLVFGIIGILVGYLVPEKPIFSIIDKEKNEGYVNHGAVAFNTTLDVCKMVGLILFCVGGVTLAIALLFPSFLTSYCDEEQADDNFKVPLQGEEEAPLSPVEMSIPKTSQVKSVQPLRSVPESVVTQEGMVEYKE